MRYSILFRLYLLNLITPVMAASYSTTSCDAPLGCILEGIDATHHRIFKRLHPNIEVDISVTDSSGATFQTTIQNSSCPIDINAGNSASYSIAHLFPTINTTTARLTGIEVRPYINWDRDNNCVQPTSGFRTCGRFALFISTLDNNNNIIRNYDGFSYYYCQSNTYSEAQLAQMFSTRLGAARTLPYVPKAITLNVGGADPNYDCNTRLINSPATVLYQEISFWDNSAHPLQSLTTYDTDGLTRIRKEMRSEDASVITIFERTDSGSTCTQRTGDATAISGTPDAEWNTCTLPEQPTETPSSAESASSSNTESETTDSSSNLDSSHSENPISEENPPSDTPPSPTDQPESTTPNNAPDTPLDSDINTLDEADISNPCVTTPLSREALH